MKRIAFSIVRSFFAMLAGLVLMEAAIAQPPSTETPAARVARFFPADRSDVTFHVMIAGKDHIVVANRQKTLDLLTLLTQSTHGSSRLQFTAENWDDGSIVLTALQLRSYKDWLGGTSEVDDTNAAAMDRLMLAIEKNLTAGAPLVDW